MRHENSEIRQKNNVDRIRPHNISPWFFEEIEVCKFINENPGDTDFSISVLPMRRQRYLGIKRQRLELTPSRNSRRRLFSSIVNIE
jgi:hypothetical protein